MSDQLLIEAAFMVDAPEEDDALYDLFERVIDGLKGAGIPDSDIVLTCPSRSIETRS